jgi:hypothetical protein
LPVLESRIEDDAEAEEEKLPIVVRPGHIRFEPIDEGKLVICIVVYSNFSCIYSSLCTKTSDLLSGAL